MPQHDPSNEAANPPRDVTKNLEKSITQAINDDELFSKTVQISTNAGNDEVAKSDDANAINDKNNVNSNDAEVNKANVVTHAIESVLTIDDLPSNVIYDDELFIKTEQIDKNAGNDEVAESNDAIDVEFILPIKDNKADQSHASLVVTLAIKSSIPTEANKVNQTHACQDADGKNSNKELTSNYEISDDNTTCSESICCGDFINYDFKVVCMETLRHQEMLQSLQLIQMMNIH